MNRTTRWWTSDGDFSDGATTYSDSLDSWQGGQCPGCTYTTPTQMPTGDGISINFTDATHAIMTVGNTTLYLERFNF